MSDVEAERSLLERTQLPLRELKEWLINEGSSLDRAIFTVESIRAFRLHYLSSTLSRPAQVGISAMRAEYGGQNVWLHVLWPTKLAIDSAEQSTEVNGLIEAFTLSTAIPLLPNPSLHLDFISQNDHENGTFEDTLRSICVAQNSGFIGILKVESTPQEFT